MKTGKGYKIYPLAPAQKLHFYCLRYYPKKQVLNIGFSPTVQVDLDWDVLKDRIREVIAHRDTIRLHFTHDKEGNVYQYMVKEEMREIEHFDFTGWREEDAEGRLREWTGILFERYDSPIHHIVMIRILDGYQGLYICVDHMTMDTQSLILFSRDVIKLYISKLYDEMDHLKEMSPYIKQLEKDLVYGTGNRAYGKDRQFFQELIAPSEPIFMDIYGPKELSNEGKATRNPKLRAATNIPDNVEVSITNFHLEGDSSGRLLNFCEEYGISMTRLLSVGLWIYLQKKNDQDDVFVTTTISRQAILPERRYGGSRTHCFPLKATVPRKNTLMEGLLKIRDAQSQYFRHADYSPSEYFNYRYDYYKLRDGQTYESLNFTYQPLAMEYDGPSLDRLGGIKYKTARYPNGVAARTLYLTTNRRAEDNGLDFGFEYQTGVVTPERLEHIYYYLCGTIFRGVEDPGRAVGEIIEVV